MKKNTKGFTLIELLAVIVILAIIALIATPIVLNLINKARKGAAVDTAYGVKKAAELYYAESLITSPTEFVAIEFTCTNSDSTKECATTGSNKVVLNIDGTIPDTGSKVAIASDGTVTFTSLKVNGYTVNYNTTTKQFSVAE